MNLLQAPPEDQEGMTPAWLRCRWPAAGRVPSWAPGAAGAGLQVQRPELIGTDHPPIGGRMVIQVQDPAHLGDEVRVGGGLPGLGGQPADPSLTQDLPDAFAADPRDPG